MKAIDRVRNAYQAKRRSIVVPEWEDMELFFGPLTVEDMVSIESRLSTNGTGEGEQYERSILMLIHKAKTKEGRAVFNFGDKKVLMSEADLVVINRVVAFMSSDVPSLAEAKEQVETDPLT